MVDTQHSIGIARAALCLAALTHTSALTVSIQEFETLTGTNFEAGLPYPRAQRLSSTSARSA